MAGTATIGALRVVLGLDSASFTDGLSKAQKHLQGVGKSMQRVGAQVATVGAGMTLAITGPLIAAGFAASKAATEAADAMGQVDAALTSMGDASGRTREQLAGLADGLMRSSLYDDDDILRKVTANLLTFGNVSGSAFDRAQQAAVDLATRMQMDLQPATLLIGKALNDPIKGLSALGRAGIQFTDAQKQTITAMVAGGNAAGAQAIMLSELERQFGGSAAAAQNTDPYDKLRDSLATLSEKAGEVINRFLVPMTSALAGLLDKFNGLSPQMQTFTVVGAAIAAALGPVLVVVGAVVGALGSLATAFAAGGVLAGLGAFAIAAAPFVAAGAAIAAAIWVFRDDLIPVFNEFKKAVMDAVGPMLPGLLQAAKDAFAALGPAIKAVVDFVGPILAGLAKIMINVFGPQAITMLRVLVAGVTNAFAIIGQAFRVLAALFKGDWSQAWNAAGTLVGTIVLGIGRVIDAVFPGALAAITRLVDGVRKWFSVDLFKIFGDTIKKIQGVGQAFFDLYDAVVGHSYIPDMVEGVAAWMAKLDAGMVVPAVAATDATRAAFERLRDDVAGVMDRLMTDSERAALQLARDTKTIKDAVAAGIIRPELGRQMEGAAAWEGAALPDVPTLGSLGTEAVDIGKGIRDQAAAIKATMDDAARQFGDAFAQNMERVLTGDIKSVFLDLLSDVMRSSLSNLGAGLFKSAQGGGFSEIGKIFTSVFGGSNIKIPGFSRGTDSAPGGLSYVHGGEVLTNLQAGAQVLTRPTVEALSDSLGRVAGQMRDTFAQARAGVSMMTAGFKGMAVSSMAATAGMALPAHIAAAANPNPSALQPAYREMVDARKTGPVNGGGLLALQINPSPYFDAQVEKVAGPQAAALADRSFAGARKAVPSDMAKTSRYSRSRS